MVKRGEILLAVGLLAIAAFAKDKKKAILPDFVLSAHTVAVIIEPGAGISIENPRANQEAQKDVETALLNWGRYEPQLGTENADLIIVLRKGSGHLVDQTIPDARQNNRAGVINPIDNGIGVGAQHGNQPDLSNPTPGMPPQRPNSPQTEISSSGDSFVVYNGGIPHPLDSAPVWRYLSPDGLQPHSVPAVAAFKKAVADAEKAAAKKP